VSKRFETKSPEVVYDEIDGEYVIVDLASGKYFRIQGESGKLFSWIISGQDLSRKIEQLSSKTNELIYSAIGTLIEKSIIRESHNAQVTVVSNGLTSFEPKEFVIEEFTDLQDIIGLDPIHEVDLSQGWPVANEPR
jgi:hypothetical protein